jgi:hypothetical protein
MLSSRIARVSLIAAAVLVLALPAAASAASAPKVRVSKHLHGPYVNEILDVTVDAPRDVYAKVAATSAHARKITFTDETFDSGDYKISSFLGDKNVSEDAQGAGFDFKLKPDHPRIFRLHVKPLVADPGESCLTDRFTQPPGGTGHEGLALFELNDETGVCG